MFNGLVVAQTYACWSIAQLQILTTWAADVNLKAVVEQSDSWPVEWFLNSRATTNLPHFNGDNIQLLVKFIRQNFIQISEFILKEPLLHTFKELRAEAAKEEKLNQENYLNSVERQYKYTL